MDETKITAKFFKPMYDDFDRQLYRLMFKRDAFMDKMIEQELSALRADLAGKRLSAKANAYISGELKKLGGRKVPPLHPVSIKLRKSTAQALEEIVRESNLVRDAFLNRLVMFLRSSDRLLTKLGMATAINDVPGAQTMPTSPMKVLEEVLADPFFYLRADCRNQHGCGLYALKLPKELHAFSCYLADDEIPGTPAFESKQAEEEALWRELDAFENALPDFKTAREPHHG